MYYKFGKMFIKVRIIFITNCRATDSGQGLPRGDEDNRQRTRATDSGRGLPTADKIYRQRLTPEMKTR
jgi:hypothetical protein